MKQLKTTGIQIKGFGHYFPKKVLKNDEIQKNMKFPTMHPLEEAVIGPLNDLGVESRYRSDESETCVFMGAEAMKMAIKDANLVPEDIDLLINPNWSERYYVPDLAPQIAKAVGLKDSMAFDLCGACTGFLLGVQTAICYLSTGKWKRAAVVTSERFSIRTRLGGYGEYTAGDGAACVILEKTDDTTTGIVDVTLHHNSDLEWIVSCSKTNGLIKSFPELIPNAIQHSLNASEEILNKNNVDYSDIDWFVAHPGTYPVLKGVSEKIPIPKEKHIANFHKCGNMTSASIPIALSEEYYKGTFRKGDKKLFLSSGVGAGWYWGGLLFIL